MSYASYVKTIADVFFYYRTVHGRLQHVAQSLTEVIVRRIEP